MRNPNQPTSREPEIIAYYIVDQNTAFLFPDKRKKALHAAIAEAIREEQERASRKEALAMEALRKERDLNLQLRAKLLEQQELNALHPVGR